MLSRASRSAWRNNQKKWSSGTSGSRLIGEAQRVEQIVPGRRAVDHRGQPARFHGESVARRRVGAGEVDLDAVGEEVHVPAASARSGDVEAHGHRDPFDEVPAEPAEAEEVGGEPLAEARDRVAGCAAWSRESSNGALVRVVVDVSSQLVVGRGTSIARR